MEATNSGSILIIDDEDNLRKTLTRILINAGWSVTGASNGAEALKMVVQSKFDLVLLDLRLPDMHGIEILRKLRKLDRDLYVIVLTAYGTMNSAVDALQLGAMDYLQKPIDPETLISRTETIFLEIQKEKRKKEIQEQITYLQNELANLEKVSETREPKHQPFTNSSRYIYIGPFSIDLHLRKATFAENLLNLPPATFEYFLVLSRHTPEVVKYQTLVTEAQGYPVEYSEAKELAKWHIHVIRQEIEPNPRNPKYIINVRGIGYQLLTS